MSTALTVKTVQLPDAITFACASVDEIQSFVARHPVDSLPARERALVKYAYARACYRASLDLTVEQVAILAETTVERIQRYARRLKLALGDLVPNNTASRIMCAMVED